MSPGKFVRVQGRVEVPNEKTSRLSVSMSSQKVGVFGTCLPRNSFKEKEKTCLRNKVETQGTSTQLNYSSNDDTALPTRMRHKPYFQQLKKQKQNSQQEK
mmetsp:Transcript_16899/g.36848  ORF Transcript_16899/g.36848 Transcript_16899/m.36848 type:complete len:100 (+) Transcript_16899:564-863(+)